jgi:hypothetical protein
MTYHCHLQPKKNEIYGTGEDRSLFKEPERDQRLLSHVPLSNGEHTKKKSKTDEKPDDSSGLPRFSLAAPLQSEEETYKAAQEEARSEPIHLTQTR